MADLFELVRYILRLLLEIAPKEEIGRILDEEAQRRAEVIYAMALAAKFPKGDTDTEPPSEPPGEP